MIAELISIGDEILLGQTVNTNAAWIGEELHKTGITLNRVVTISDNREAILNALDMARSQAELILITGGLGPTRDDITKNTLAEYFDSKMIESRKAMDAIRELAEARNMELNELNRSQAMVPDNCEVIPNKYGTAPGMWFREEGKQFISLPGVPYEMKYMMAETILSRLKKDFDLPVFYYTTVLTQGIPESHLADRLQDYEKNLPENVKMAYLPSAGIVKIRLGAEGRDEQEVRNRVGEQKKRLLEIIGEYVFGTDEDKLEQVVGELLRQKGWTLATAESCTGGAVASAITSVPGSSDYFKGSVVAYANEIKTGVLNIDPGMIEKHGAVSEAVVREMATHLQETFQIDCAIATSGIAGPSGGTKEKPVGTTWIAVGVKDQVRAEKFNFGQNRERNIQRSVLTALNMLRRMIKGLRD